MDNSPKLCGGTFFTIIVSTIGLSRTSRNFYAHEEHSAQYIVFRDLIRIIEPTYRITNQDSFKTSTTYYKSCQKDAGQHAPFDEVHAKSFDLLVKKEYSTALERMYDFAKAHLNEEFDHSIILLVAALRDLIKSDSSIPDDAMFYVKESGRPISKAELCSTTRFSLQAFLLGVWHYIVSNQVDNTLGRDTYLSWLKTTESNHKVLEFDLGTEDISTIEVYSKNRSSTLTQKFYSEEETIDYRTFPAANYQKYLRGIVAKYFKMKTLLYSDYNREFYSFYVCNGLKCNNFSLNPDRSLLKSSPDHDPEYDTMGLITPKEIRSSGGNKVLIVGTGGLGKSMMMRHLLLYSANSYQTERRVPILIQLKNYSPQLSFFNMLLDTIQSFDNITEEQLRESLINGDVILLLDGIDEIKSNYLVKFEMEIGKFSDKYPEVCIIMSSRSFKSFIDYINFTTMELQPFTLNESLALIKKLDFRPDEPDIKKRFYYAVETELYRTHGEFIQNPLLLTIMLLTFEQYAEIPAKRYLFYKEAFDTLAQKHDATKGAYQRVFKTGLSAFQISDYIAEFCARTYMDEQYEFSQLEISKVFDEMKIVRENTNNITAEDFIYDLVNNICILFAEGDAYHFTHRSFQEYFCAVFFAKQKDKYLFAIGQRFEKKKRTSQANDQTFEMLFAMIPKKVEEYIFLPYLDDIQEKATYTKKYLESMNNETIKQNMQYISWLKAQHGYIYSNSDITGNSKVTSVDSLIYQTILNHLKLPIEYTFENLTETKEFLLQRDNPLGNKIYRIEMKDVIEHNEEYSDILSSLTNPGFALKNEYHVVNEYYEKLLEQRSPSNEDFFNQFQ